MPAPDGIFVMGELGRRIWQGNGYPKEQVLVTGGLRYQHVRISGRVKPTRGKFEISILLIAGMNEALDIDMCTAVSIAVQKVPSIHIRLRDHPHYCLSERRGFRRFRRLIEVTTGTAQEDLNGADLVIFTHSAFAEEALLLGIPTWQWLWAGFNTSVFLDLPVIPTFSSVADLRRALQSFVQDPHRYRAKREVQDLVLRQCFGADPARASVCIADKIVEFIRDDGKAEMRNCQ
ncbi:hypothetical protein MYX04_01300 [Nitrospiraceae bacterium AH_259_D15_M11_P09]|nr:hypothetical protein [Nitrospiraceae bacterium AH_259_D15_M11_P09]